MKSDKLLQQHLLYLLKGDGAHLDFESAVKEMPLKLQGVRPKGAEHSPWEVLEHMRIAQRDVLESIRNPKHVSPEFPKGYWPAKEAPPNGKDWERSAQAFLVDREALAALLTNDVTNMLAPLPNTEDQTVFRKILMAADHNAYHLGELVLLRRSLGAWS